MLRNNRQATGSSGRARRWAAPGWAAPGWAAAGWAAAERRWSLAVGIAALGAVCLVRTAAFGHGNVTPQPVDVKDLPKLQGPLTTNPYRGTAAQASAVQIGSSAFNQNCARCHGLEAVSGGIAPDLRHLPKGADGDEYFQMRIRNGSVRNGVTYMPAFGDIFSEEAIWAIRSYLDSRYEEQ